MEGYFATEDQMRMHYDPQNKSLYFDYNFLIVDNRGNDDKSLWDGFIGFKPAHASENKNLNLMHALKQ